MVRFHWQQQEHLPWPCRACNLVCSTAQFVCMQLLHAKCICLCLSGMMCTWSCHTHTKCAVRFEDLKASTRVEHGRIRSPDFTYKEFLQFEAELKVIKPCTYQSHKHSAVKHVWCYVCCCTVMRNTKEQLCPAWWSKVWNLTVTCHISNMCVYVWCVLC